MLINSIKYLAVVSAFIAALPTALSSTLNAGTTDACGNPNNAILYVQGYSQSQTIHGLGPYTNFIGNAALGGDWVIQNPVLRTWETQQPGTVPLYRLWNPTTIDLMYQLGNANGTLPSAPGFLLQENIMYVYTTQVCGSVPMFVMNNAAAGDHYYSTDPGDPGRMAQFGYADEGILAYVLPPFCGCN